MDALLETWKPTKIIKRSKSMNLVQGLSQFKHMDYVSEYSIKPQDYSKPRRTATNAGSFSKAGETMYRLESSRGVSSPTVKNQLNSRRSSISRATNLQGGKKRFIKKRPSAVELNKTKAMLEYKKMMNFQEEEENRLKLQEENKKKMALRNKGKHVSEIIHAQKQEDIKKAVAKAKRRVRKRGKQKPSVPQQLLPFGIGKAKNSWFDQHFKPKEEDDETLYRDKVHFFLRMQSKSKSNTIEQDLRSWKKASPYIGSVVERGLVQRKRQEVDYDMNLDILRYPADPSGSSIASLLNSNTTRTYRTAFNPSVPRLHTDTLKYDGPGPNMRIKPTFHIDRPNRPSYAFIAASRAKAHVNPIL